MELVVDNPFRVLGLPATASSRDIAKRVSDLETFAELGKSKSYPTDFPHIGALSRTVDAVKDAAKKIEHAESKLFHSFFWVREGHEGDTQALTLVANGDFGGALALWNAELSKDGRRRHSSRLNRAVLYLWLATKDKFDRVRFDQALTDLGFVIDEHLEQSVEAVLGAAAAGLNKEALWKRVVDALVATAQAAPNEPYGVGAMALASKCKTFPPAAVDYIRERLVNPVIETLEAAIVKSAAQREASTNSRHIMADGNLRRLAKVLPELQFALGEDDTRYQVVANAFANEVCQCAIDVSNKYDDEERAVEIITWAMTLPAYGRVKDRLAENKPILERHLSNAKDKVFHEPIKKLLDGPPPLQVRDIRVDFIAMKAALATLAGHVGKSDENYIAASSACAHRVLGFVIDQYNALPQATNRAELVSVVERIQELKAIVTDLLQLDVDKEARDRVVTNLQTMAEVGAKLAIASKNVPQPSAWSKIPGWLWVVGIIVLIAMFK